MDDHSNEETTAVIQKYLHDQRIRYQNSFVHPAERLKTTRYATLINSAPICRRRLHFLSHR